MWSLCGLGITFMVLFSYKEIHAGVIPRQPPEESKEPTASKYGFLDQVSASKIECLLKFIEQPDTNLDCIDKLFGDERSQFLLNELREELEGDYPLNKVITTGAAEVKDGDQLVADLNTLSEKTGQISTVNDDIPIINSNIDKRVDEQVDTPKKEEQRNGNPAGTPQVTAEVVKSTDEDTDDENQIDEEYDYDSSLVSKLYNMLQDLVMKETFDYGLNMDEDDSDSDEDQPGNLEENTIANVGEDGGEEDDDSEEDEGESDELANELGAARAQDNEDEIEKELRQMQGAETVEEGSEEAEEEEEETVNALEKDLVKELDKMLSIAKQAVAADAKGKAPSDSDIDDVVSDGKFLEDLRHMEKQLKDSRN